MDMELPGESYCKSSFHMRIPSDPPDGKKLLKAVNAGKVPMKRLDDMAQR
jgi:hypothetical protein